MIVSLTYISLPQMMYALIASFMYGQIVRLVQQGGYSARGILSFQNKRRKLPVHHGRIGKRSYLSNR